MELSSSIPKWQMCTQHPTLQKEEPENNDSITSPASPRPST